MKIKVNNIDQLKDIYIKTMLKTVLLYQNDINIDISNIRDINTSFVCSCRETGTCFFKYNDLLTLFFTYDINSIDDYIPYLFGRKKLIEALKSDSSSISYFESVAHYYYYNGQNQIFKEVDVYNINQLNDEYINKIRYVFKHIDCDFRQKLFDLRLKKHNDQINSEIKSKYEKISKQKAKKCFFDKEEIFVLKYKDKYLENEFLEVVQCENKNYDKQREWNCIIKNLKYIDFYIKIN